MSERSFKKKQRNQKNRNRKPVIVIAAEGRNKTEKIYIESLKDRIVDKSVKFIKIGATTDPYGLFKGVEKYWNQNELLGELGDKAYIMLDADCDKKKLELIKELENQNDIIRFIISNPCIEIWFLQHFGYSTKAYVDSKEPKKDLATKIDGYKESMDISSIINPHILKATENIEKLKIHYEKIGIAWGSDECNPMTDVPELLKELGVINW